MATVRFPPATYPDQDCKVLHDAMKGFGSNKSAIIGVLARRNLQQRQQIIAQYQRLYGKNLIQKLKDELTGNLEKAVVPFMLLPVTRDAEWLHEALFGVFNDRALAHIICARTPPELVAIQETYRHLYRTSLLDDVSAKTVGNFQQVLLAALKNKREAEGPVDMNILLHDVSELYRAGEARLGTNESRFAFIFTTRSYTHLRAVFDTYAQTHRKDIEQVLRSEMSGNTLTAYMTLMRFTRNPHKFFAHALYKSMKGMGTDDASLIRTIVSRCEWDMEYIKMAFQAEYGKPLDHMIISDTSGEYKHFLLMLIGAE